MSAIKARKLADGSREVTHDESDNFSIDDGFSLEESRTHKSSSSNPKFLENSSESDDTQSETEDESSQDTSNYKKRRLNGDDGRKLFKKPTLKNQDSSSEEEESDAQNTQNGFSTQATETDQDESISDQESEDDKDRPLTTDELQADCGTIESLTLINFMCHEHFEIEFNPRVNFVIGKNGSGKSAILTAIVVVLGGRATNTGRGQSLTGFIKNGKQSAKIIVKLCNYSTLKKKTFKYHEYGKSIIVERIIKSDGTSNYLLKSATGKLITRKKEELNEIISLFSIQIENPVCILSQEVSRSFLNSKNPRDKYNFFMKATNLEQLRQAYAIALQQSKTAREILAKKKSFLPGIEKELKELEKKVDVFTKFNKKKDELKFLICELLWSMVKILEIEETEPPKAIKNLDDKIEEAKKRFDLIKKDSEELERLREHFGDEFQVQYEEEMKELENAKSDLMRRLEEFRKNKIHKQMKINETNFSLSACNKDKAQLNKKIADIKVQIVEQEKLIAEQKRMEAQKVELRNEQSDIKQEIERLRGEKEKRQEDCNKTNDQLKSINLKISKLSSELSNKNNLLNNLKGSDKNSLSKFGSQMTKLVLLIEEDNRRGRFKKKPVGPLGHYIKLKDEHVSTALEACLRGLMFAFVCDNLQDADHLVKLARSCNFHKIPLILKRKFGPRFNVNDGVTLERYKSFLHYVTIENDQAFNILMDKSNLDQTLYIPNDKSAVELLTNKDIIPPKLKVAYSAVGTQFYPKRPGSNFRQYANNQKASGILTSDPTMYIQKIDAEVTELKEHILNLQNQKSEIESISRTTSTELKELDKKIDKCHTNMNNISRQLYELSSVKEFKPEDLSIFETEYQECINQINTFKDDLQTLQDDLKDIDEKVKIIKNDQKNNENSIQERRDKYEQMKKKVRDNEFNLKKNSEEMDKIERRIVDFNERREIFMKELAEIQTKKNEAIERAKRDHEEPIDTDRKPDEIQIEIDELNHFLTENENRMGNKEELLAAYSEKKAHYDKMRDQVDFLEVYITEFSESIRRRARIYCQLRNYITHQTSTKFAKNLKLLNFTGYLKIFHKSATVDGKLMKEQTLDIKINPKSSDPKMLYNDTRSLSGGERSFSTVAFLIALWESSYSPFNILDEVDVFMDMVTRNLALDALIDSANKKKGKQYIFLSPLRPEKKGIQNLLKIFYMPEPKRVVE